MAKKVKVESSNISEVGYNKLTKTMSIVFKRSGREYTYKPISNELYQSLISAESVGRFFADNIKSNNKLEVKEVLGE